MLRFQPIPLQLLLFLLLPLLSSSQPDTDSGSYYDRCKDPYLERCGTKEHNISYPFTVDGKREGCGRPEYVLRCSGDGDDKNLTIRILNEDFNVLNISYTEGILTVSEQDIQVDPSTCTVSHQDAATSIDPTLFELTAQDVNLTLFRCPPIPRPFPSTFPTLSQPNCEASSPILWHLILGPVESEFAAQLLSCNKTSVVVKPPIGSDALQVLSNPNSLEEALRQGFDIRWKAGSGWCSHCLQSGGTCGYNSNNPHEQTCYCSDGTTGAVLCNEGGRGIYISFEKPAPIFWD